MILRPRLQPARRTAHRHEVLEAIAAVDVHAVGDRPETVRRIEVAVDLLRPLAPPQALTPVRKLDAPQVVQVAALGVKDLPEEPLPHHVEDHHLGTAVVAVLHHHAVLAVFLRGLDELPAVVQRHRRGDLGRSMFPVLHRRDAHRHVPFPRCRVEDEVDVCGLAEPLEIAWSSRKTDRLFVARLDHPFLHQLDAISRRCRRPP